MLRRARATARACLARLPGPAPREGRHASHVEVALNSGAHAGGTRLFRAATRAPAVPARCRRRTRRGGAHGGCRCGPAWAVGGVASFASPRAVAPPGAPGGAGAAARRCEARGWPNRVSDDAGDAHKCAAPLTAPFASGGPRARRGAGVARRASARAMTHAGPHAPGRAAHAPRGPHALQTAHGMQLAPLCRATLALRRDAARARCRSGGA